MTFPAYDPYESHTAAASLPTPWKTAERARRLGISELPISDSFSEWLRQSLAYEDSSAIADSVKHRIQAARDRSEPEIFAGSREKRESGAAVAESPELTPRKKREIMQAVKNALRGGAPGMTGLRTPPGLAGALRAAAREANVSLRAAVDVATEAAMRTDSFPGNQEANASAGANADAVEVEALASASEYFWHLLFDAEHAPPDQLSGQPASILPGFAEGAAPPGACAAAATDPLAADSALDWLRRSLRALAMGDAGEFTSAPGESAGTPDRPPGDSAGFGRLDPVAYPPAGGRGPGAATAAWPGPFSGAPPGLPRVDGDAAFVGTPSWDGHGDDGDALPAAIAPGDSRSEDEKAGSPGAGRFRMRMDAVGAGGGGDNAFAAARPINLSGNFSSFRDDRSGGGDARPFRNDPPERRAPAAGDASRRARDGTDGEARALEKLGAVSVVEAVVQREATSAAPAGAEEASPDAAREDRAGRVAERVEAAARALRFTSRAGAGRIMVDFSGGPELGEMRLHVALRGGVLSTRLRVASAGARRVMRDGEADIRAALLARGLNLGDFAVEMDDSTDAAAVEDAAPAGWMA